MADPRQLDADHHLWLRIRCAAILAGYGGPRELAEAMNIEGLSYTSLRRLSRDYETIATSHEYIAEAISEHCASRGVSVPAWWLLGGFEQQG